MSLLAIMDKNEYQSTEQIRANQPDAVYSLNINLKHHVLNDVVFVHREGISMRFFDYIEARVIAYSPVTDNFLVEFIDVPGRPRRWVHKRFVFDNFSQLLACWGDYYRAMHGPGGVISYRQ